MKTRVLSSLAGLVILGVVLVFLDTPVFNAVIGLIVLIAVSELLHATGIGKLKSLSAISLLMAAAIPLVHAGAGRRYAVEIFFILILLYFIVLLSQHSSIRIEQAALSFFLVVIVSASFSCAIQLRDDFGPRIGGFYLIVALGAAWLSDTGAYFVGRAFGRRKLAPYVSPNKTVEGSVGGMVVCAAFMMLLAAGYGVIMRQLGDPVRIHYGLLFLVTPIFSIMGMLGDLSASVIKRQFQVKDFGHIMPGHGGVMDRFDSVLFTMPCVYIFVRHIELITPL